MTKPHFLQQINTSIEIHSKEPRLLLHSLVLTLKEHTSTQIEIGPLPPAHNNFPGFCFFSAWITVVLRESSSFFCLRSSSTLTMDSLSILQMILIRYRSALCLHLWKIIQNGKIQNFCFLMFESSSFSQKAKTFLRGHCVQSSGPDIIRADESEQQSARRKTTHQFSPRIQSKLLKTLQKYYLYQIDLRNSNCLLKRH